MAWTPGLYVSPFTLNECYCGHPLAAKANRQIPARAHKLKVAAIATKERPVTIIEGSPQLQQSVPSSSDAAPRQRNGEAVKMRSLDVQNGDAHWWQGPGTGHPQSNGRVTAPAGNGRPRTANGSGAVNRNGAVNSTALIAPQQVLVRKEQLPAQLAAELETDAGSREFVQDSEFRWSQDTYNSTQRSIEIWAFIIQLRARLFLLDQKWSYHSGFSEEQKSRRMRSLAAWTRESVLQLGPTFIKLGQLFSTRSDLFPSEFTEELSKLQDRVPAFPSEKAIKIVEEELGAPLATLYRTFDRRPIAGASLGQVHRATLHSGEEVVVKVQRPGLRKLFDIDLANMRQLAVLLDKGDPARDCKGIYEECRNVLYEEIDYINEGRNADRFRRNFRDVPWVKVPRVSWQRTSPAVITLEYMPGIKISDRALLKQSGLDVKEVASRSTEAYIIQVLRHGFLHADPHSGNLAVSSEGTLIYYDYGMMVSIAPATKERLMDMFYAVYKQDARAVIRGLTDLGIIVATGDTLPLERAIGFFLANLNRQAERQETLSAIGEDLFSLAVDQPFRFPASFTFVLRAFSTLEGIGKILVGNDYSFAKVAAPYANELLSLQNARTFALDEFGKQAGELSYAAAAMPGRVAKIEDVTRQLQQGSLKLRVRDPASERAMRRSGIMQMATLQAVAVAALLDVGTQLQLAGKAAESYPVLGGAAVLAGLIAWGFRRIRKLDKFEKDLKSGGNFGQ